jgi:electron transfer flavoprotein alpha subunit
MTTLVIAEHNNNITAPSTRQVITAASQLGDGKVDVLVAGKDCSTAAETIANLFHVSKVLVSNDAVYEHTVAEDYAKLIVSLADDYQHIVIASDTFGKNILPRAAALLDVAQITDVIEIVSDDTFKRPIYAGNAIATVQSTDKIKLLTIRTTAFEKCADGNSTAPIEDIASAGSAGKSSFVGLEESRSDKPDLTSARVVVSGGRGVGSAENFKILESLADTIGDCAIGASRAAVDAGYVPNDLQVGQTGKVVAPELYIAVGISGAIQHLAGMKDSKVIVAINKDENAPIFEIADIGLVADLFDAVPKMEKILKG